ncbi:heme ABC exporter ATP-binding protein CcmA [Achromobacter deleyi]|uniref:heme ABC exporter ATP-binding protein CcmA n=1 Tax=Achromobacter deleyi TaxID=1353891 RepID=UPI001E33B43D|nr:heme ABC exporter ATP-binding protein CcmA [Achromobacter deleyi]
MRPVEPPFAALAGAAADSAGTDSDTATADAGLRAVGLVGRRGAAAPIDLALAPGQLLRVRGANGSGKTSLLRMLAGLLRPLAGGVQWRGRDIRRDPASYHARMAFLSHGNGLCGELSAADNLRYALAIAGAPAIDTGPALRAWRLEACAEQPAARLSQGQGRRLALAATVLAGKPLWLLDEPDAGLDAASLDLLDQALAAHLAGGGLAVVASHRPPGLAFADMQTLDMDDYADAGNAVAVGAP